MARTLKTINYTSAGDKIVATGVTSGDVVTSSGVVEIYNASVADIIVTVKIHDDDGGDGELAMRKFTLSQGEWERIGPINLEVSDNFILGLSSEGAYDLNVIHSYEVTS